MKFLLLALAWTGARAARRAVPTKDPPKKEVSPPGLPSWWPFASTCVSSSEWRDNTNGKVAACGNGMACLCPRHLSSDGSWNCVQGEDACRNIPHATPR
jgi:hypothetical protein